MVQPTLPPIEESRESRPQAEPAADHAPQSVVEHHLVEDAEWGEIEAIVVYGDAA